MSNILSFARDSLTSFVANLGTSRDKASTTFYGMSLLSDDQILQAYRGAWLPRKIVDIPAFDSVRAWRDWQAKGSNQKGRTAEERDGQIGPIEAEEKRLNVQGKVYTARQRARLWGGAAIMIGTGEEDLARPLEIERVGKGGIKYLTVLSRRQLRAGEQERDPASEFYGQPGSYQLSRADGQPAVTIHPSRLCIFQGNQQPDDDLVASVNPGWGDSILMSIMDAVKNADSTAANIASLVFEAKIDVFGIPDLMANIGNEQYRSRLVERYTLAATTKSINGALIRDKEEEFETKTISFATLPDVLDRFLQIVSGAADIPATRLLGQSPAGMNSTGESDLRNYYDRLSAMQAIEMTPAMYRLDECLIRSALGSRDPDIYYDWAPLWGLSATEKATIFKTKADAARTIAGTGGTSQPLMPIDALSDALVNTLIEDNALPGLEAAIEEYGRLSEQEEDPEEAQAAVGLRQVGGDPTKQAFDVEDSSHHHRHSNSEEHGGGHIGNRHGNHFNPAQARGANGRWIETGAEGQKSYELSAEHRKAIEGYTGSDYKPMNWQLRGVRPGTAEVTDKIKSLDAALSGWTLGEPATVYRGIGSVGAKKLMAAGLRKGEIIEDPGFMSTSRSPSVAKAFAQQSSENIVLEIRAKGTAKALDVRDYSDAGGAEQEVLFARSSRLKVLSFDKKRRTLVVETVDD